EQQQDAEDRRAGRADGDADRAAERPPEVAAVVPSEREHQAGERDDEPGTERPHVDERAAHDHQPADPGAGDRHDVGGAADDRIEPVVERAADIAPVPAGVDHAAEEDTERDEREPPELGMLQPARASAGRPALLDAARSLGAQLALALLARHAALFARRPRSPT